MLSTLITRLLLALSLIISPVAGQTASPSASFNFEELTIPYLRARTYDSQFTDLIKQSETNTYTSYLTSYDSDGNRVNALLNVPKLPPPPDGWPAVIFVHGYIPPERYQTTRSYASYLDYPSENGLVVLKIDLRGHGQSGGDPGGSYYSSDYVIDTLNAYEALKKRALVNPKKIGLWGHSMAGNIVLRALATNPEIGKVVIWAGAGYTYDDLREYRIRDTSYRPPPAGSKQQRYREELFASVGQYSSQSAFWQQVPATNYLENTRAKIQLHHSIDDPVVNIAYSRNLKQILDRAGLANELYEYPFGGHNFTGATFTSAIKRTTDFLKQ